MCLLIHTILVSTTFAGVLINLNKPYCIGTIELTTQTKEYEKNARNLALKHKLTDLDVLARLIFSEGLSTGCLGEKECSSSHLFKENIFDKIGWGISKRIKNSVYDVVFKKYQFRTSFSPIMNGNKKNIFANFFLCPEMSENYLQVNQLNFEELFINAKVIAKEILTTNKIPYNYQHVSNFYYPKSPVFGKLTPKWAKESNLLKEISNNWIKFYRSKHN